MKTHRIQENQNGESLTANQLDIIEIKLDENPTTGYRWVTVDLDKNNFEVIDETYSMPDNNGIGAGGLKSIKIKCLKSAQSTITIIYQQAGTLLIDRTFILNVEIV